MQWLIDGHNLIGQMPGLRLDDPDDEDKLAEYLRRYCARTGHRVTVIFDAGQAFRTATTKKQGCLTVQFAPSGQTADQLIRQRLGRVQNPQALMVVSSDQAVRSAAHQARVRTLKAEEFSRQLLQAISASGTENSDSRIELQLSADEVDEWLKVFNNQKHARTKKQSSANQKPGPPPNPSDQPGATPSPDSRPRKRTGSNKKRTG